MLAEHHPPVAANRSYNRIKRRVIVIGLVYFFAVGVSNFTASLPMALVHMPALAAAFLAIMSGDHRAYKGLKYANYVVMVYNCVMFVFSILQLAYNSHYDIEPPADYYYSFPAWLFVNSHLALFSFWARIPIVYAMDLTEPVQVVGDGHA